MKIKSFLVLTCFFITVAFSVQAQDVDSKLSETEMALMNGNNEQALNLSKDLIERGKGDSVQLATMYCYAGLASDQLKKPEDAINYYKKSIELKVPRLDIYDRMISLTKKMKKNDEYEWALLEKQKAFPDFKIPIDKSLANLYLKTKQFDKLLAVTNELIEAYPENPAYYNYQGVACQNLGKFDQAIAAFKKVLELDPDHSYANMSLGMIYYKEGSNKFDQLRDDYEKKKNPNWDEYIKYHNSLDEPEALYRKALPYLLKAYKDETYAQLKDVLSVIYTRLGEKDKAAKYK